MKSRIKGNIPQRIRIFGILRKKKLFPKMFYKMLEKRESGVYYNTKRSTMEMQK